MFRAFSKTIAVTFIDHAAGTPIARSDVPLEQLPETFALDTQLELAGVSYTVVSAEPQTKAEFAKTKRLSVKLQRIEMVDPKTILFSMPSICGAALPQNGAIPGPDTFVLHEDDWRQCEFVASSAHQDIAQELSAIREIHTTRVAGSGWRKIHVRDRIARPLPSGITWTDVTAQFREMEHAGGVAFHNAGSPVLNAVAVRLPNGVLLWGVEEGGDLGVLCVESIHAASESTVEGLKRIADSFSLALVHWCRCQAYAPSNAQIAHAMGSPWDGSA